MTTNLKTAIERSSYFPIASFFDEDLATEDVKTLTWTLTDIFGNIINGRDAVVVAEPSSVETIVLSDGDLAVFGDDDRLKRLITFEATYDSVLGSDAALKGVGEFTIIPLVAIPNEAAL